MKTAKMHKDEASGYFGFLLSLVEITPGDGSQLDGVLTELHETPFTAVLTDDDTRVMDGMSLRAHFRHEDPEVYLINHPQYSCSVLELLIALAIRMSEECDRPAWACFEMFMCNLGLHRYTDSMKEMHPGPWHNGCSDIVRRFVRRTYKSNGTGGLFPLKRPNIQDQRQVPLWYQMNEYMKENDI